jgi:hypothetical protein
VRIQSKNIYGHKKMVGPKHFVVRDKNAFLIRIHLPSIIRIVKYVEESDWFVV